jgi:hypothetical protein
MRMGLFSSEFHQRLIVQSRVEENRDVFGFVVVEEKHTSK